MKTPARGRWARGLALLLGFGAAVGVGRATLPDLGGGGEAPAPAWLDYWSFSDTNTWASERGYAPVSFTNLDSSFLGNGSTLGLDHTNAAWLQYRVTEADGTNHLAVARGSVLFWFAPSWSGTNAGGSGPGQWGRLIETGMFTTNASQGWWSLYTDPAGVNLYFGAQTNGATAVYLAAPIAWTTNRWHLIALTYSATNSTLYLDGVLATNGPGVTIWPGAEALTNGFFIGSDSTGVAQARGMFDDLSTYAFPLAAEAIAGAFGYESFAYYLNMWNFANFGGGGAHTADFTVDFNVLTGAGHLLAAGTNAAGCVTNSRVWLTNVTAVAAGNGTLNVTFTIAGGGAGARYDVFGNSVLAPASEVLRPWTWLGQGYHCSSYTLTNLPGKSALLLLGTPVDSDGDGLTDAYENLVSKTDPQVYDSNSDGLPEAWAVLQGWDPNAAGLAGQDADADGLSHLQEYLWGADPTSAPPFALWVAAPQPFSSVP